MIAQDYEKIKVRILVPLALAFTALILFYLYISFQAARENLSFEMDRETKIIETTYRDLIARETGRMSSAMKEISLDLANVTAFQLGEREWLLKLVSEVFGKLKAEHQITHFYFHKPERVVFLRLHEPKRFGDKIERTTLLDAEKTGREARGMELGPLGTFTLRVVMPWYEGGELIGYLEIGEEIGPILLKMKDILDVRVLAFVEKSFLTRESWENGVKKLNRKPDWNRFHHTVITGNLDEEIPEDALKELSHRHMQKNTHYHDLSFNGKRYEAVYLVLTDAGQRNIGHIVFIRDVTRSFLSFRKTLFITLSVSLLIGGGLFLFFYIFIGRIEKQLFLSRERLREESAALKKSENRLQSILDNSTAVIYLKNCDGKYILTNKRFEALFHMTRDEIIGKTDHDIFPEEIAHAFKENDLKVIKLCEPLEIEEIAPQDDGPHTYLSVKFPLLDQKGVVYSICGISTDITERKKSEDKLHRAYADLEKAQLASLNIMEDLENQRYELDQTLIQKEFLMREMERTNKELKDFAYIVSHDLKAPLRGISQLAGWLKEDYAHRLDKEGQEQLALLVDRTRKMHNLIEGILEYSRVGRMDMEKEPVETRELIENMVDLISPPENIKIKTAKNLPQVKMNRIRLGQVFQNLIGNAVKYIEELEGLIEVGCRDGGDVWEFHVKDNGPGIDKRHFDRIFQIFQKLGKEDTSESTGIGLTIVKKIVEQNGGTIWVESELGKGSTFFFTVPKA